MDEPILFEPRCTRCQAVASRSEIIPANQLPREWASWPRNRKQAFEQYRDASQAYLLYSGLGGSNGWVGDPISAKRVAKLIAAFETPSVERFADADLYDSAGFCGLCQGYYCQSCWNISSTGGGNCPQCHLKSLDPHWSPE